MDEERTYTAFAGEKLIASGTLESVLPEVKASFDRDRGILLFIFDDQTGRPVDFELRGSLSDVLARALPPRQHAGPGRPKLGVVSREISLLPRHWEWLEAQPNGASAALRRLVDEARKKDPIKQRARAAMDTTVRFLGVMGGDRTGYEEATRALYAGDGTRFQQILREWPQDIREHAVKLASDAFASD
jgi:hypothetical protein